ncbi:2'-5' RNA ligase family protein [Streptomyces sp. NPDC003006]
METFFSPARRSVWAAGPYLHFLVLLNRHDNYRAYARAHRDLFSGFSELGVVPEEWLHCTVQGLYHPTTAEQSEQLINATRRELVGMRAFTVQMGPTWPGVTAVTVAMYPEAGVAELNRRVRAAAESVPGIELRPAPAKMWAHSTLAYVKDGDFDDRPLNRGLRSLRPERVDVTIDRFYLVSQHQRPDLGYYTWDVIEEFPLC